MLEAKAFLLSPAELGVVISLKHTRQRAVLTHGPFFASVCTRLCQYVIWGFGNGLKKRRKTKTQVAQNPESIEPQGFPGCIFFGNKRQSRQNLRITIVIRRFCFFSSVCTRNTTADCSLFHKYYFKTQVWAERIPFLNLRILLF